MSALNTLVSDFAAALSASIEAEVLARVRSNIASVFDGGGSRPSLRFGALGPARARKKPPIQLCPVPGCKNRAAPIFGMVCSEHKDLPKKKIREYREARRAAKNGKEQGAASRANARRAASKPRKRIRKAGRPKYASRLVSTKRSPARKKTATAPAPNSPLGSASPSVS